VRAFLIDPEEEVVIEIDVEPGLRNIYDQVGGGPIDIVRLNDTGDVIYIDDNGLYRQNHFFALRDFLHPIAGPGLVLGTDSEGDTTDTTFTDSTVIADLITWITPEEALTRAREADRQTEEAIAARQGDGWAHVHISSAEILESREYTNDPF